MPDLISYLAYCTQLLPVILYLIFKKRIQDKALLVICFLQAISFCIDTFNIYFGARNHKTYIEFNLYTLAETILLLWFYTYIITQPAIKKIILFFGATYFALWLYYFIRFGVTRNLEFLAAIEALFIILISIYYFYEQALKADYLFIYKQPRFLIVAGFLIYTAGTFFLFLLSDSLNQRELKKYYILNSLFVIIKIILVSIAMVMKKPESKHQKFQLN